MYTFLSLYTLVYLKRLNPTKFSMYETNNWKSNLYLYMGGNDIAHFLETVPNIQYS